MAINNIELTDDFSTWRDNFNLTVNKVNELDLNDASLPAIETEPTANTLVQRTSTGAVEATSFVEGSSLALKDNIRPLEDGLSLINQFNPVFFDWRKEFLVSNEKDVPGLIAEEVHKILPQITTYNDPQSAFGIKYTKIIAILIKAVQELSSEVKTLKSSKQTVIEQPKIQDEDLSLNKLFEK